VKSVTNKEERQPSARKGKSKKRHPKKAEMDLIPSLHTKQIRIRKSAYQKNGKSQVGAASYNPINMKIDIKQTATATARPRPPAGSLEKLTAVEAEGSTQTKKTSTLEEEFEVRRARVLNDFELK